MHMAHATTIQIGRNLFVDFDEKNLRRGTICSARGDDRRRNRRRSESRAQTKKLKRDVVRLTSSRFDSNVQAAAWLPVNG
jgi:hypothetical protein